MTQSVADKTPLPDKAWRRHTDPPALWIAVATISITLHLLLFWLLRSYSHNLLSRQSSSNPIPIDFVEISSQPKASSNTKPVLSKRVSTTEKSSVVRSPKSATQENLTPKSTSTVEDSNAIALTNPNEAKTSQPPQKDTTEQSSKRQVILSPEDTQPLPQPVETLQPTPEQTQPEPPPQPTPEVTPQAQQPQPTPEQTQPELPPQPTPEITPQAQQPQPTPEPTTASDNPEPQNQANQELDEQNQASNPQNNTTNSPPPDSSAETPEEPKLSNESTESPSPLPGQPDEQVIVGQETPLPQLAPPVKPEQSPLDEPKAGGVALATWDIEADAVKRDIQDNPPQIVGDIKEKELDSLALNTELGEQPIEFKVVLLIDSDGNFNSLTLYDLKTPEPQATQYREYAEKIFKDQKFIPASSDNGNKPPLGQLVVNIKIQRTSPKS
ncbi:hypothetical protein [Brasilonema sp. UFV-L1]|uniref:hypothetical protein n=1 Tax=Brasilonema sp. UFV-L1 TaxID=2234130 RepID=UPI00145CFC8F|nr:hypothetical protein [Brasilonema sp. UFV-L1]NMG09171.1 hypothetical protein [Brasilonema sp. UFV-L1]